MRTRSPANPPADAEAGDGFGWRRRIAKDAVQLLKPGAPLILQALSAYGEQRFGALAGSGLSQWRTLHRHGPVEMDLSREDLQVQLRQYAAFEAAGGERHPMAASLLVVVGGELDGGGGGCFLPLPAPLASACK